MTTVEKLKSAAERALDGRATLFYASPVIEINCGRIIWEGVVSEFKSEQGESVFTWVSREAGETHYVAVLQRPPVKDAITAVRSWLVSQK